MGRGNDETAAPIFTRLLPPFAGLPLGPLLTLALRSLARRRPQIFERLGDERTAVYLIDPVDLPFSFSIIPDGRSTVVRAVSRTDTLQPDVVVRGPILMLLGLLDGTFDGDALFFDRTISISGRTEAVVALRNAIEDAELHPSDLLGLTGTVGRLADACILDTLDVARRLTAGASTQRGHRA
jgi:predicted lipid carrier protein YhbT